MVDYDEDDDFEVSSNEVDLHPGQTEVFESIFIDQTARYAVCCCSRGWGKSFGAAVVAITAVHELIALDPRVPHKRVYIIAPTHEQVTDIYYPLINFELGMEHCAISSSKDDGVFKFASNVELRLLSYESVERMRGKGAYFVVWDEVSSCKKGLPPKTAWEGIIQPTLVTRWSAARAKRFGAPSAGRALLISTPKGYNFFYDAYTKETKNPEWKSFQYDYTTSPYLDISEIEKIKSDIDPIDFASEYRASFQDSGNNVFYCFDRKTHVVSDLEPFHANPEAGEFEDVHVAIDFNVGIMCTSVFAVRGGQIHILDELRGHPDTETLAISLRTKYKDKGHKVYIYPDPSGRARKSSAPVGRTDFTILENQGLICLARTAAPPIVDSVQAVNRLLKSADGNTRLYVHSKCEGVTKSLERTKWVDRNPDTATIDKSEGIEHYSDGVRYAVEYLFPIQSGKKRTARGFNF
jgi:hypothetical protein